MPLLPPGHTAPMPATADAPPPPIEAPAEISEAPPPPPMPGAKAAPPPIHPGIHDPESNDDDEAAEISVVADNDPPPPPAAAPERLRQVHEPAAPPPPPSTAMAPPPPASMPMPAGTEGASSRVMQDLAEEGFEGLSIGFGSFPVIRLKDTLFSTNDDIDMGQKIYCVMHATKEKWLLKKEDDNKTKDFVYSYDQHFTTSGKPVTEIMAEWQAAGYDKPVWKRYLDVTAQLYDVNEGTLGDLVVLSVPQTSVAKLTGYLTTIKLGRGLSPSQVITLCQAGQKVTSVVNPFYPWSFKFYANLD